MFFAYIGFDAISVAAEETKNPQRNLPIGILGGLGILHVIYVVVGAVLTGLVPYQQLGVADPRRCVERRRIPAGRVDRGAGCGGLDDRGAAGVSIRPAEIFFSMARDGLLPKAMARIDQRTSRT